MVRGNNMWRVEELTRERRIRPGVCIAFSYGKYRECAIGNIHATLAYTTGCKTGRYYHIRKASLVPPRPDTLLHWVDSSNVRPA